MTTILWRLAISCTTTSVLDAPSPLHKAARNASAPCCRRFCAKFDKVPFSAVLISLSKVSHILFVAHYGFNHKNMLFLCFSYTYDARSDFGVVSLLKFVQTSVHKTQSATFFIYYGSEYPQQVFFEYIIIKNQFTGLIR